MQNREFKFKAWHMDAKIMLYGTPKEIFQWVEDGQPVIPLQFSGLTDKNGKKIFEGDVVDCGASGTYEIVFQNGKFVATYMDNSGDEIDGDMWREIKNAVIIGNIYENPDLIK